MTEPSLSEDVRFMLGEIRAIVNSLPGRMDRFEESVNNKFSNIEARILVLEKQYAAYHGKRDGVSSTITTAIAFFASLFSGMLTYLFAKH